MPPTPQYIYIYIYIWVYMDIWVKIAIYGHIWVYTAICRHILQYIYIYIYIYMCVFLEGPFVFFISSVDCSTLPPDIRAFGSDTPHCWHFFRNWSYENVPMDRGIISCFRRKVGFDLFFTTQNPLFEEIQISVFIVYLQRSIMHKVGKAFIFLRFPFGKGSYFLEIPTLRNHDGYHEWSPIYYKKPLVVPLVVS